MVYIGVVLTVLKSFNYAKLHVFFLYILLENALFQRKDFIVFGSKKFSFNCLNHKQNACAIAIF